MQILDKFKLNKNFEAVDYDRQIKFIVFHHIEAGSVEEAISLLDAHQVSSHYIIDEKGEVYRLVDDNDIAYHAGFSYFKGVDGLNNNSIGIELFSKNAYQRGFSDQQYGSLIELTKFLTAKYNIALHDVVGHSDIAYYPENCDPEFQQQIGFLNRKDDPSHLFNWALMAQNGAALCPVITDSDCELFKLTDRDQEIVKIKENLHNFGYKISSYSEQFDLEMVNLSRVFNRRFNQRGYLINPDIWWLNNSKILQQLVF